MSNFNKMVAMIDYYLLNNGIDQGIKSDLHVVSDNSGEDSEAVNYVYNGKKLEVIDMDAIARNGYKKIKKPSYPDENPINSVDAFLINSDNEWYFIEFKDTDINKSSTKESIIKKAYSNWYMLMDMLYEMSKSEYEYPQFDYNNPMKFAEEHVYYILVCTVKKNGRIYQQIKNQKLLKSNYTPPFMSRLKSYLFKDVYVYTEHIFEREFALKFKY